MLGNGYVLRIHIGWEGMIYEVFGDEKVVAWKTGREV